jgi:hypothetical protein
MRWKRYTPLCNGALRAGALVQWVNLKLEGAEHARRTIEAHASIAVIPPLRLACGVTQGFDSHADSFGMTTVALFEM